MSQDPSPAAPWLASLGPCADLTRRARVPALRPLGTRAQRTRFRRAFRRDTTALCRGADALIVAGAGITTSRSPGRGAREARGLLARAAPWRWSTGGEPGRDRGGAYRDRAPRETAVMPWRWTRPARRRDPAIAERGSARARPPRLVRVSTRTAGRAGAPGRPEAAGARRAPDLGRRQPPLARAGYAPGDRATVALSSRPALGAPCAAPRRAARRPPRRRRRAARSRTSCRGAPSIGDHAAREEVAGRRGQVGDQPGHLLLACRGGPAARCAATLSTTSPSGTWSAASRCRTGRRRPRTSRIAEPRPLDRERPHHVLDRRAGGAGVDHPRESRVRRER